MTPLQKILMVSNGHGEDLIGNNLLTALKKHHPNAEILTAPLVGKGHSYEKEKLAILFQNPAFPSGGFIRSLGDILRDIQAGVLSHIRHQRQQLRNYPFAPDTIFAVGDIFALWMAQAARKKGEKIVFLPTAKSNRFMPHSKLEKWCMKRWCHHIFTRDQETCDDLVSAGLPAEFCGNPMMDNLRPTGLTFPIDSTHPTLALLPGSREEAYSNLSHLHKIIQTLRQTRPTLQVLIARSPALEESRTTDAFPADTTTIHSTAFTDILHQADLVIGLSGTANEQAVEVGKTVLAFPGFGPQSTPQRFKEQQKLLGEQLIFNPTQDITKLSQWINGYLEKRPAASKKNLPTQSAADTIINRLTA